MPIPTITREYAPGACRNWRKLMRLILVPKIRPDSPALHAEEFLVPNQTHKEPPFPWWNSRESPGTLSQDKKNTAVTSGMQNRLVYPKSTQDEAHFPWIVYIAISCSTSYTPSGLTSFRKIQIPWDTHLKSRRTSISVNHWRNRLCTPYRLEMRADSLSFTEEISQLSTSTSRGVFPQEYVFEKDTVFSALSEMDPEMPDSKEGWVSLLRLKCSLIFHITRWKDVWSTCRDPTESPRSPPHVD